VNDLSIITVTYQSAGKLPAFLAAARAAAPSAEIVVVDNASRDGTRQLVEESGDASLVPAPSNLGFGRGCNLGVEQCRGVWLLFVNPDVLLQNVVVPSNDNSATYGLRGGLMGDGEGGKLIPGVRAEATLAEDWIMEVLQAFVPPSLSRYLTPRRHPVAWPIGGMCMARRDEYERLGGFDPRYFLFFEDRDLGRRYRQYGLPVRVVNDLVGSHAMGSSSDVESWRREAWSIISWIEYLAVWRSPRKAADTVAKVLATLSAASRLAERRRLSVRIQKKAHLAGLIANFLADFDAHLPEDAQTYYPGARLAMAAARGS
jgi:hypothetical protein